MSQPILEGLALRKHLRGVLAQLECHVRRITLAACFRGWKGGVGRCRELAAIRRSRAVHYRAYAVAAAHVRALLRAAKAAYLDELGCAFAGASLDKDVKALFKALKGLVPALRSSPGFRLASLVKEGPGAPFADSAEAAVGWSKHFGAPEGGLLVDWKALEADYIEHAAAQRHLPPPSLHQLPDLLSWEAQFRSVKAGKAPGPDGLGSSAVKLAVPQIAFHSYALTLKTAATRCEPLRWRGGNAIALHKGKGHGFAMSEFRSVLLSDIVGKRWHAWLRSVLVPHFLEQRLDLQAGVAGGQSTGVISLHVRAFVGHMLQRRQSSALIFVDVKSAFYSIMRQFALGDDHSLPHFFDVCARLGLSGDQVEVIRDTLALPPDCSISQAPPQARMHLQDLLKCTWFQVAGCSSVVSTCAGSRPGDPLADMLFGMLLIGPLKQLSVDLEAARLCPCIHVAGILSEGSGERVSAPIASWHDDLVLMIATDSPDALLPGVSFAIRRVHDLMAQRNLRLNLSAGKTEVLCIPAGKASARLRSFIRKPEVQHCAFLPDHGCMATVRLVDRYKHLGSWICDSSSLLPEIRYRLAYARSALRPLRKPVFARPGVSSEARTYLFQSLILSRACHNIGALSGLTEGEWDVWQAGILGLYKVLLPRPEFTADAHVSSREICRRASLPAPAALVRIERLRLLGQLVEKGATATRDLLEAAVGGRRCWLSDVVADVRWCRALSPSLFPNLPPDWDAAALWQSSVAWKGSWHFRWPRFGHLRWNTLQET